jgi:cysteinyl-tRNA synthetase
MSLQLFDTYTRQIRKFEPLNPDEVGVYVCGPTVYDYAHIGNLRTYLFEDILRRTLEYAGYKVKHVMNITDVGHLTSDADTGEDKMEKGSKRTGMTAWEMADHYAEAFRNNLAALNVLEPDIWCRATDHIQEQIEFVEEIEKHGFTYKTSDGIYFLSQKLNDYGHLARLNIEGLQAGARVEQGEKRAITDFALWKFSPENEVRQMEWDSPWGRGFPGWHIECSAMSAKYLGDFFDIHCGGEDHIPVHHTNEIAQTQACKGTHLANFWMHGYFLQMGNAKMAKSSGEFIRLETLQEQNIDPLVYRYFCLTAHYRTQLSFSWESLEASRVALNRLYRTCYEWGEAGEVDAGFLGKFEGFLFNDLNMPRVIALIRDLIRSELTDAVKKATLLEFDRVLGLDFATWEPANEAIPEAIKALAAARESAREAKNWAEADLIRDQIADAGYAVEDTADGSRLTPKP